jgi:hypothetical protein
MADGRRRVLPSSRKSAMRLGPPRSFRSSATCRSGRASVGEDRKTTPPQSLQPNPNGPRRSGRTCGLELVSKTARTPWGREQGKREGQGLAPPAVLAYPQVRVILSKKTVTTPVAFVLKCAVSCATRCEPSDPVGCANSSGPAESPLLQAVRVNTPQGSNGRAWRAA